MEVGPEELSPPGELLPDGGGPCGPDEPEDPDELLGELGELGELGAPDGLEGALGELGDPEEVGIGAPGMETPPGGVGKAQAAINITAAPGIRFLASLIIPPRASQDTPKQIH